MYRIESALLYVDPPAFSFAGMADALNEKLAEFSIVLDGEATDATDRVVFNGAGFRVQISVHAQGLPAEGFLHALESPLSAPFKGMLSDTLFRHKWHVLIGITRRQPAADISTIDRLNALRLAHAAGTVLAATHRPCAVHWRQSNQLITGAQYEMISQDATPWALFAQARLDDVTTDDRYPSKVGLRLDEAAEFVGRPIIVTPSILPMEQSYAAALSFLRFYIQTGEPIADGETFGQPGGLSVVVNHRAPDPASGGDTTGCFELSLIGTLQPDVAVQRERVEPARHIHADRGRKRSLAISFMMLVVIPPIGLLLLISNAVFGSDASRTSLIASTSIAVAILIATFSIVTNYNAYDYAVLDAPTLIVTVPLVD